MLCGLSVSVDCYGCLRFVAVLSLFAVGCALSVVVCLMFVVC